MELYEKIFRESLRIRMVEESIISAYPSDLIQSPVHLSIGQEAIAVAACMSLKKTDLLFGTYRSHAYFLAKGGSLGSMFSELYGRLNGVAKGKAGSMHLAAPEVGFMGSSAIVASNLPNAAGAALAARVKKTGQVIMCVYGDGATEQGVYHETLNFSVLENLPLIFLCENNGLAVHATLSERQKYTIADHARGYGLEVIKIENSWDYLLLESTIRDVVFKTKQDSVPRMIEVITYRYKEHVGISEDFHFGYRDEKDYNFWRTRDPLINRLDLVGRFSPEITSEINLAVDAALSSPFPGIDELLTDII